MNVRHVIPACILPACVLALPSCKAPEEQVVTCMEKLTGILEGINDRNTADQAALPIQALAKRLETLRETLAYQNRPSENRQSADAIITLSSKYMVQLQRIVMASYYNSKKLENVIGEISR